MVQGLGSAHPFQVR